MAEQPTSTSRLTCSQALTELIASFIRGPEAELICSDKLIPKHTLKSGLGIVRDYGTASTI